jgi:hypothetical protein
MVLTEVECTQYCSSPRFRPSSDIVQNTWFRELNILPSSGETPLSGPLENTKPNRRQFTAFLVVRVRMSCMKCNATFSVHLNSVLMLMFKRQNEWSEVDLMKGGEGRESKIKRHCSRDRENKQQLN